MSSTLQSSLLKSRYPSSVVKWKNQKAYLLSKDGHIVGGIIVKHKKKETALASLEKKLLEVEK